MIQDFIIITFPLGTVFFLHLRSEIEHGSFDSVEIRFCIHIAQVKSVKKGLKLVMENHNIIVLLKCL